LHDVIEDTDYTIENLRENGYSKEVLEAIDCLTKRDGENYDEYLKRSMSNPIASKVDVPVKSSHFRKPATGHQKLAGRVLSGAV